MPASHLVYARGARLALISATMRKIGRRDCILTCPACLHQTIKDAPCASVQGAWQRCLLNINASKQPIVCKVCSKVCSSFPGVRGTHNRFGVIRHRHKATASTGTTFRKVTCVWCHTGAESMAVDRAGMADEIVGSGRGCVLGVMVCEVFNSD
ncbi:hypothetical protein E1301_Tti001094 [Triplophysa tibetana]|uniref:Uncharacterized protein n=1 Tax=Triplophysa tibetana TaxID=1572043 RepID=A0A5A9N6B1_9TELE|nr:hypothetical protein E1301_Tti001094 [Triplophysa tibetana]